MIDYVKDPWNWVHFLGSCVLAVGLYLKVVSNELAFIAAFGVGLVWELGDYLSKRFDWDIWFLDKRGFCFRDIIVDLIGVLWGAWFIS